MKEEEYMKMFDENKNEKEKLFYIREMKEEEYMKMLDENKHEKKRKIILY